ncbi:EamA family transporter [Patescibacteria group bacterium]|nr:EamA family transporter [Patescibacteria group bacterium]MBU1907887.1 EamA family transporter [Patescibacteria group bacterium]
MVYLLTFFSALSSIIGNILGKYWADRQQFRWMALMLAMYVTGGVLYAFSLRYGKYTIINSLFYAVVPIVTVLSGIIIFRERLTMLQTIGLCLGLLAVIFLTVEGKIGR